MMMKQKKAEEEKGAIKKRRGGKEGVHSCSLLRRGRGEKQRLPWGVPRVGVEKRLCFSECHPSEYAHW